MFVIPTEGCLKCRRSERVGRGGKWFCGKTRIPEKALYNKKGYCARFYPMKVEMRKTIEDIRFYVQYAIQYARLKYEKDREVGGYLEKIENLCNMALAEPQRNCDVGSVEEQRLRYRKYCESLSDNARDLYGCDKCPYIHDDECALAWAQAHYKEGSEKTDI